MRRRASSMVKIPGMGKPPEVRMDTRLAEPGFVERVCQLMSDPRIVETFSVFDKDNSGSITTEELREVITMLQLASNKTDLDQMLKELDINNDGGVDLWEFCVYLQKGRDAHAEAESNWELDQAFQLFAPDEDDEGRIDEAALKRMMTNVLSDMPLDEAEWVEMWEHMVAQGLVRGGKISVHELRKHECWQAKAIGAPSPATTPRR